MTQLAIDDEAGRQLQEAEVVGGLLLPTNQYAPETVEPGVTDLHHPAARRVTLGVAGWGQRLCRAGLARDVRRVAAAGRGLSADIIVVAAIQAQVRRVGRRVGRRG